MDYWDTLTAFLPTLAELEQGDFIRNQGSSYTPTIIIQGD